MKTKKKEKTINYLELVPKLIPNSDKNFLDIFNYADEVSKTNKKERFIINGNKRLYLNSIKKKENEKKIYGKISIIRMDEFPEIFKTTNNSSRDIERDIDEGLIESTHFILSYTNDNYNLAFEFNQYGARFSDFLYCLTTFGIKHNIIEEIKSLNIVKENIEQRKNKIGPISSVFVKVHKNKINSFKNIDQGFYSASKALSEHTPYEEFELKLKFDKNIVKENSKAKKLLNAFVNEFKTEKLQDFDKVVFKAEDISENNKMRDFDLLNLWIRSKIKVELKHQSKSLLSSDMFEKMNSELENKLNL